MCMRQVLCRVQAWLARCTPPCSLSHVAVYSMPFCLRAVVDAAQESTRSCARIMREAVNSCPNEGAWGTYTDLKLKGLSDRYKGASCTLLYAIANLRTCYRPGHRRRPHVIRAGPGTTAEIVYLGEYNESLIHSGVLGCCATGELGPEP
ncbi:hypothetical protein C8Q80DRAFT_109671 [Daedaleopsis nitida]|nr:hypothetical protein C8Q80DRAFT_109671 [Daedaleopsis nitida]